MEEEEKTLHEIFSVQTVREGFEEELYNSMTVVKALWQQVKSYLSYSIRTEPKGSYAFLLSISVHIYSIIMKF